MKKILLLLLIASPSMASFNGWSWQRPIFISSNNYTNVFGPINNFPGLISANDNTLSTTTASGGRLNSTGFDLAYFSDNGCQFILNYDTETVMNVGVSTMNTHVQLPPLSTATLGTTIYMCYGNAAVTTYIGHSTGTWISSGTWHLPNGVTLSAKDSTAGAFNGTISGPTATTGKIDGAASFTAASANISVGGGSAGAGTPGLLDFDTFTYSAWVSRNAINADQDVYNGGAGLTPQFRIGSDNKIQLVKTNVAGIASSAGTVPITTLTHIAVSWDNSTGAYAFYINGALSGSGTATVLGWSYGFNAHQWRIGYFNAQPNEKIDEMRVYNNVRNSDWINAEYNSGNSPTTFAVIGAEVAAPSVSIQLYGRITGL